MSDEKKTPLPTDQRFNKIVLDSIDLNSSQEAQSVIAQALMALKKSQDIRVVKLALDGDPLVENKHSSIFKRRINAIPTHILKRVRDTEELIGGIILPHRSKQGSLFGRPRPNRFDIGFEITIKPEIYKKYSEESIAKLKEEVVPQLRELLINCGRTTGLKNREKFTFSQYLSQIIEDLLLYGWWATEVRSDLQGRFHSFQAVDAGTIYYAIPSKENSSEAQAVREKSKQVLSEMQGHKINTQKFSEGEYTWVQVINETPYQAFTDDELLVWSFTPSTDIERSGYPISPIERIMSAVSTHINLTTHNRLYFLNGRAARQALVFQADNLDRDDLEQIRAQMQAHINSAQSAHRMPVFGIGTKEKVDVVPLDGGNKDMEFQYLADLNKRFIFAAFGVNPDEIAALSYLAKGTQSQALAECLDYGTEVLTPKGLFSINSLLSDKESVTTPIWSGTKWVKAKIFKTGIKPLRETILSNGLSIKTSPDHYFLTINRSGGTEWKPQALLTKEDYVLVNKKEVVSEIELPTYKGKAITPELMEVLGWLTGDGTIVEARRRAGAILHLFYHHEKEVKIQQDHLQVLKDFGLKPLYKKHIITKEEAEKIKKRYGFKAVASERIKTLLYDTDFVNWMISLGFSASKKGKTIPSFIYTLPSEYKQSFLRGLFSADGGVNKGKAGVVSLAVANPNLRKQVKTLLLTLGIRTNFHEGSTKQTFVGQKRKRIREKSLLAIKDKRAFFTKVGFLQGHKQPQTSWLAGSDPFGIPVLMQQAYIEILKNSKIPKTLISSKVGPDGKLRGHYSANLLKRWLKVAGKEVPQWMSDYHCVKIKEIIDHKVSVEMADITVFEDSHAFVADGVVVHNSNNEWKLNKSQEAFLRPMLNNIEDFINERLLVKINPEWAQLVRVNFAGLDADSPEKEATILQQASSLYMTYNDIMDRVEEDRAPIGGDFPLSAPYLMVLEKYYTKGQILKAFGGEEYKNADKDPNLAFYMGDQAWLQMQGVMAQQQAAQQAQQPQGGQPGQPGQPGEQPGGQPGADQGQPGQGGDLDNAIAQLGEVLGKAEKALPTTRKELLKRHTEVKAKILAEFKSESKDLVDKIMQAVAGADSNEDEYGH